ncbi:MAG: gamma-glutamyltransferase, partial [Alphaproteobacteria bacterium]
MLFRPALMGLALCLFPAIGPAEETVQPERTFSLRAAPRAEARIYMAATANPLATRVAADILARGGSAADAAIAAQFMLNLVEPQSSGIGGGTFLLYWDASDETLTSYDGRETAPLAATPRYWLDETGEPMKFFDAVPGGRSVGVPGTLAALEALHDAHGRLPWADLLAPAIELAETGFEVSPRLAKSIAAAQERGLTLFEPAKSYFFNPDGTPLAAGTVLKNPEFALTLRLIADAGAEPFYDGVLAGDIVAAIRHAGKNPGVMTREDFSRYQVILRPPVCVSYRVYEVCGMGPPSSGGLTVGQILKLLEPFDLAALGDTAETWHLFAEA